VHRVAHLVQAVFLRLPQPAAVVECVVFEEKADLVAGFVEIAVVELGLPRGRKDVPHRLRIEFIDEFQRALAQPLAGLDRHEILENQHARGAIIGQHRSVEPAPRRRLVGRYRVEYLHYGLASLQTVGGY
jgi:hypothetical protein